MQKQRNIKKKSRERRNQKLIKIVATMNILAISIMSASADAPAGVDTESYNFMIDLVFWVAGIAIAAGGGIPSVMKIVHGHTNEDPRERNSGISGIVVTGAMVGALAAVRIALF